jgi:hypothetical protein
LREILGQLAEEQNERRDEEHDLYPPERR